MHVCINKNEYSATDPKNSESFKCFSLLLQQPQIQQTLIQGNANLLLRTCIDKDEFVELLFEMTKKHKWDIEKQFGRPFKLRSGNRWAYEHTGKSFFCLLSFVF